MKICMQCKEYNSIESNINCSYTKSFTTFELDFLIFLYCNLVNINVTLLKIVIRFASTVGINCLSSGKVHDPNPLTSSPFPTLVITSHYV